MKSVISLLFLLCGFTAGEELQWTDFNEGHESAKAQKKAAVIDFYTDWCKWCKVMDEKTYGDPSVKELLLNKFVTIKINPERSTEAIRYDGKVLKPMELAGGLGVQGFPATAFMGKDGKFITLVPGYIPPETFHLILKYMDDECYRMQMPLDEYQKNPVSCKLKKKKAAKPAPPAGGGPAPQPSPVPGGGN
jgi:thioredoxin-related protein